MIDFRGHTDFAGAASLSIHNAVSEATAGAASAIAALPGVVASVPPARGKQAFSGKFSNATETAGVRPRAEINRAAQRAGGRRTVRRRATHSVVSLLCRDRSERCL